MSNVAPNMAAVRQRLKPRGASPLAEGELRPASPERRHRPASANGQAADRAGRLRATVKGARGGRCGGECWFDSGCPGQRDDGDAALVDEGGKDPPYGSATGAACLITVVVWSSSGGRRGRR